MAEVWMPKSPEILKHWVDAVEKEAMAELSEWERNFIASIKAQLNAGKRLTQAQEDKLETIYAEHTD